MCLPEVVVEDSIPVSPLSVPSKVDLSRHLHLRDIALLEIEGGSVTLLIENDCVAAHRCLESRFSPEPERSLDTVLTLFGLILRGVC